MLTPRSTVICRVDDEEIERRVDAERVKMQQESQETPSGEGK